MYSCNGVFLHCDTDTFTSVKDLNTFFTSEGVIMVCKRVFLCVHNDKRIVENLVNLAKTFFKNPANNLKW